LNNIYVILMLKQGFSASTTFQGQYMPQTDQTIGGSWELASFNWTNREAAAANWAEARKEMPQTGLI
jgi:hypothetical protein